MRRALKKTGQWAASKVNLFLPRKLKSARFTIPMIYGMKVGITSEPWMLDLLAELLPQAPGVFLDVGINLGQTMIKVRAVDPRRVYVGFEPNPACIFYLLQLIERNQWGEQTTILPVGLSNENSVKTLTLFGQSLADPGASVVAGIRGEKPGSRKIHVPVFSYAALSPCLPAGRTAVIKIDVEGAELEVLEGLREVIQRDGPVLIFELLPVHSETNLLRWGRQQKILAILRQLEYSLFRIQKTQADHFAGLLPLQEVGVVTNPLDQNYVALAKNSPVRLRVG